MEAGNRGLCWIVTCNCVIMIEIQTIAGSWIRCLLTRGDLILVLFNRLIWLFFNFLVILYFVRCDTCKFHLCCQFCSPRLVETFTIHFHLFTLVKSVHFADSLFWGLPWAKVKRWQWSSLIKNIFGSNSLNLNLRNGQGEKVEQSYLRLCHATLSRNLQPRVAERSKSYMLPYASFG